MSENIHDYSSSTGRAEIAAQRIVIAALESGALDLMKAGVAVNEGHAVGKYLGDVMNALKDALLKKA